MQRVILIHPAAPAKPAEGAACNGCGVCCLAAPCPLGIVASRSTTGPCAALVWNEAASVYRCGLIEQPARHLWRIARPLAPLVARFAKRYIASGSGCDSDLTTAAAAP